MRMNKYDYARTVFFFQGLRIFSVLMAIWTTVFTALTIVNLFTKEWDEYPGFFPYNFPTILPGGFFDLEVLYSVIEESKGRI